MDILDLWGGNLLSDVKKLYGTGCSVPLGEQRAADSLPSAYGHEHRLGHTATPGTGTRTTHRSDYNTLPSMTQLDLDLECEGETL